jgi:hypothetical protein
MTYSEWYVSVGWGVVILAVFTLNFVILSDLLYDDVIKELLSRNNWIYYGRLISKTHEHYNYLQWIHFDIMNTNGKLFTKDNHECQDWLNLAWVGKRRLKAN